MAVENKWVDTAVEAGKRGAAGKVVGGRVVALAGNFEIAAADSNGSIYKLAKLPANAVPVSFTIFADASIDATDVDLGLYKENGDVADVNLFADGLDLNAGVAITAGHNNGLTNLGGADPLAAIGKRLWELLGLSVATKADEGYILALTANVAGGAAGTIGYKIEYILA